MKYEYFGLAQTPLIITLNSLKNFLQINDKIPVFVVFPNLIGYLSETPELIIKNITFNKYKNKKSMTFNFFCNRIITSNKIHLNYSFRDFYYLDCRIKEKNFIGCLGKNFMQYSYSNVLDDYSFPEINELMQNIRYTINETLPNKRCSSFR